MRRCLAALALAGGAAVSTHADTLTTPSFEVRIDVQCPEGNVTCDRVRYTGTNRKTGQRITLKGSTWHTRCADGVAPCRMLGYQFRNGNILYLVLEEGYLRVTQGSKVLLEEQGEWTYGTGQ